MPGEQPGSKPELLRSPIRDRVTAAATHSALQRNRLMVSSARLSPDNAELAPAVDGPPASAYFRSAATWLTADLQSSLRLERADLMQVIFATRRFASAHCFFTSAAHAFAATVASAINC